jgi:hypothetical protein
MSVLLLAQAVGWPVTGIVLVAVLGLVYLRRANVTRADAVRR